MLLKLDRNERNRRRQMFFCTLIAGLLGTVAVAGMIYWHYKSTFLRM
jgi:hypothetical protein